MGTTSQHGMRYEVDVPQEQYTVVPVELTLVISQQNVINSAFIVINFRAAPNRIFRTRGAAEK